MLETASQSVPAMNSAEMQKRMDDLGHIILAYSEVTDKLQQSHERLEQTVLSLRHELSEKNRLLERKNRLAALGEMAAGMAHEIRNPLGGIQLYASLLAKDVVTVPGAPELVGKITGGVKRLETLVSSVLQFTREIKVTPGPCDIAELVDQAIELATLQLDAKRIAWSIEGPRPLEANVDSYMIGQCLLNLVLNAVDAMDAGGHLSLRVWPKDDDLGTRQFRLVIRDSGPGIPTNILDRIFNPFFTTKETGTGLGLAIVHRIVDAHDGTILASNPADGGAQFEIRI